MPYFIAWARALALAVMLPNFVASQEFAYYNPGDLNVPAADEPFLTLVTQAGIGDQGSTRFRLRPDDSLFMVDGPIPITATYGANANPAGVRPGPCSPYTACQVIFQTDGNLVQYYNGAAVWQSGTSGTGALLTLSAHRIYAWIDDAAGNRIWQSNPEASPGGGPPCFEYDNKGNCVSM